MKVQFKMPREIDGANYPKGTHEVPDSLEKHWYLLACVQNGNAVILEGPKAKKAQAPAPPPPPSSPPVAPVAPDVAPPGPSYQDLLNGGAEQSTPVAPGLPEVPKADPPPSSPPAQSDDEAAKKAKRVEAAKKAAATRAANKAKVEKDGPAE